MVAIPPTHPPTTTSHAPTAGPATTKHSRQPTPTGGFTTIDAPPRRVAGVSHPYGRNSPHAPTHNRQPRTHPQPPATHPPTTASHATTAGPATTKHSRQPTPTGGFTTIDTPPRRVAGVSQPYGRNSPRAPTRNRQPRHHSRPNHDRTQPPTHAPTHNRQPRPRPCRFRATNLRLPLRTPRGGLPRAAWAPGRPGDIGSLSGTRRLGAPLHWCHA